MTAGRIVPLDRARTFITLSVVFYHAVINYTWFGIGGDRMRWLGFDLVVLFYDSFFMACMFFIAGWFVHDSFARRGPQAYLGARAWRLGIPFLVSIFIIMPIGYYRYHETEESFFRFYQQMVTEGPWSAGSAWFLWVLLAFDVLAVLLFTFAPRAIDALRRLTEKLHDRPVTAFAAFVAFSIVLYLPLRIKFGASSWIAPGHYPLPIQTSRILLYAGYFLAGVGVGAAGLRRGFLAEGGAFARRWPLWLACGLLCYAAILHLVYVHHNGSIDFKNPPLWWHASYGAAFAMFGAAMTFTAPAIFLSFAKTSLPLLDAMQPSAYGIYLVHFIPLIWLQYLVYDPALPSFVKFAIVFTGTLSSSWAMTLLLRKIPAVARMI